MQHVFSDSDIISTEFVYNENFVQKTVIKELTIINNLKAHYFKF